MKRNKTGGRTKGTLNRTTAETKELIQNVISNELDNIADLLAKLQPKERLDTIIKLLPYIVPKQSEIAIDNKEVQRYAEITLTFVPPIDYDDDDD
ncbi:hypothetical protein [Flavobacterium sp.]|uniref:hypothetical protein n=1 Tax=Flavobacterium sp. TaxID=239 RepID=UPI002C123C8E|nr:hypothetical protein [Flavobacterium sp.]HSD06514.1 hypothetical protein [Flavobacterium sp.]